MTRPPGARPSRQSRTAEEIKAAAIATWTSDPCGSTEVDDVLGGTEYFERLLAMRREYAPWMAEELGYAGTAGLRVLDVGCGQGIDLAEYAMAGAEVSGIDLTPRHVELARAHLAGLGVSGRVDEGDAESLPYPDASFDRVSSNGVLHHTPDLPAALREIHRVLRPEGDVRVILYNRASLHYWVDQVLGTGLVRGGLWREGSMDGVLSTSVEATSSGARPLVRVYRPGEVRRLLRGAGFAFVSTRVRHFRPDDAFPVRRLARRFPRLADPALCERIGRMAGWYVVGRGLKPPDGWGTARTGPGSRRAPRRGRPEDLRPPPG